MQEGEIIKTTEASKEIASQQSKGKKETVSHLRFMVREFIAIFFWAYVLVKLFIFDADVLLINKLFPNYVWLLNVKFFILVGSIAVIWLITKSKTILFWSLYVVFYPVILLFLYIPFFVFKQRSWIFAFAVINAVISFFKSIKYNFITSSFFLVSLAIIFGFSNKILLWLSVFVLFIILLIVYVHRFILVFKPSSIFELYTKVLSGIRKHWASSFALDDGIKNFPLESLNEKQMEKWTTNLQTSVLFNRVCLFAAKKLRDYQNSGLNIVSYVLIILLLIALTIFSFAAINFALYKIHSDVFKFSVNPAFFVFFYYSFNNLVSHSIQGITPIAPISQTVSMIESFFALFLIVIFVSLLLSIRGERHSNELNEAIKGVEQEGAAMESFIRDEYKINSVEDAMVELEKLKAGLTKFLYKITQSIT